MFRALVENFLWVPVQPIGEEYDVLPVILKCFSLRLDNKGPGEPDLLLQARVGVIPIGAALQDRVFE